MKTVKSSSKLTKILNSFRKKGKRIGFVPTMGALHEGHLSLVRKARAENDVVVVSIFVNPTQFGPKEDLKRYPKKLTQDTRLLKQAKIDYLFIPSQNSIYPKGFRDFVDPGPINRYLCGPKRPGHFRGVATVVKRLFKIVEPNAAYFGQKDYQQARIIEEMIKKLKLPIKIKTCPIIREKDGLAMSSRNQYLSKKERVSAVALYQSLRQARLLIQAGEYNVHQIKKAIRSLLAECVTKINYVEIVDPKTCVPVKRAKPPVVVALACFLGSTRLIDNILIKV